MRFLLFLLQISLVPMMKNPIERIQYTVDYSFEDRIPVMVYYTLHSSDIGSYGRYSFHCSDTLYANPTSYTYSGYDRGHMISSASSSGKDSDIESFDMINIVPQKSSFNRGLWKQSEIFERLNCYPYCYVICGVVLKGNESKMKNITVPNIFYKVIYNPSLGMIGFLLHQSDKGELKDYTVSVDKIEELLGTDFFYQLENGEELESKINKTKWKWNK